MPVGVLQVFEGFLAELVSGQVIGLRVCGGSGGVSVFREAVQFRGSIVRTLGHGYSPAFFDALQSEMGLSERIFRPQKRLPTHSATGMLFFSQCA
jgi:hypothetical protein